MPDYSKMPTPEEVNFYHLAADKDAGAGALHHTLGLGSSQASPGSHNHDGRNSKRVKLKDLDGVAISYQPMGGTLGTQPTFDGDPLITGTYTKWGNMCYFNIMVDMDNILTFGTGQYYLTLPFEPARPVQFSDGCYHDNSAARDYPIFAHTVDGTTQIVLKSIDAQGNTAYNVPFTSTVPATIATADNFHIAGTYEIMP